MLLLSTFPFPFPPFAPLSKLPSRISAVAGDGLKALEVEARSDGGGAESLRRRWRRSGVAPVGNELEVLYDDGYGGVSVKDYLEAAKTLTACLDGGPPRWFCPVECGAPVKGAPLLLFLPGTDGLGLGLILHHKSLGKVFEVRCLNIPQTDRTTFEGLVKFVEHSVKEEHTLAPSKPIYLVGDSFGGGLALAVAARNPNIDIVLILVNPATSFSRSQLQHAFPVLEALPSNLLAAVPYLFSFVMGDPVKLAMANVTDDLPPLQTVVAVSDSLVSTLPLLLDFTDIMPKDTLLWKLELIKSGAAYVNSRLHAVVAEVLLLVSGNDNLLPSAEEADRLYTSLRNCRVRYFKNNGHTLLLEGGVNLLTVIKGTSTYRLSRQHDYIRDFLPPTLSECKRVFDQEYRWLQIATSPVMLSTLSNGTIVRGLSGVPNKGPVILVGYHMLLGLEIIQLFEGFLKEKKVVVRGITHPILFSRGRESSRTEISTFDYIAAFGAVPVSSTSMFKLLSDDSFVLLYPGGAREALHLKGEEYKLIWPEQAEFVRMAARFGATIVPFGTVGEDDVAELVADYEDQKKIPYLAEWIEEQTKSVKNLRADFSGEVSNQNLYLPGLIPKVPGRFYYLFGKPFETKGTDLIRNKNHALQVYQQIKSEVEGLISYLRTKREEDPYRSITKRALYQASWGWSTEVPTFEP